MVNRTGAPLKLGITGHRTLDDSTAWEWVRLELLHLLEPARRPLVGISSLAVGADQLFAELVLSLDGSLEFILPFAGYERTFPNPADLANYCRLFYRASNVIPLTATYSDEEAYLQAGLRVADYCDCLIAVWDDRPAQGPGGTANIVSYAESIRKASIHLNPITRSVRKANYECCGCT
jgi:hypothetical protein